MKRILRLLLAVVAGFVIGSLVNMGLIMLGGVLIAPPAGADVNTMEGLKAAMHLFGPRHFLFPFLAHALGTLFGAAAACLLSPQRSSGPAYIVAALFLLGGIAAVFMLPSPIWFDAVDLIFAYLPLAWLGQRVVRNFPQSTASAKPLAPA